MRQKTTENQPVSSTGKRSDRDNPYHAGDLRAFERQVFSQNGEDGILEEILRRIGIETKSFVEFGVESGIECNCARLAREQLWRGLFIEGDSTQFKNLSNRYRSYGGVRCVRAWVTPAGIEDLLATNDVPLNFDVLSIDIDGNDYWVWSAIKRWRPRVVAIEYNASYPPPRKWVMKSNPNHRWDGSNYFGASLASLANLGERKGYVLVATDRAGVNAFFVREDLVTKDRFLKPGAVRYHYSPPRYGHHRGGHPPRNSLMLKAHAMWKERVCKALEELGTAVSASHKKGSGPFGEAIILVDEEQWGIGDLINGRRRIPFLEHDGQYSGNPPDDETAIRELERLRMSGAGFIVFAWTTLWWLEYYAEFHSYLRSHFRCILENERLVIFDLREPLRPAQRRKKS